MNKIERKIKRQIRIRSKIRGTSARPRLSVYRSNSFMYAQLIDDVARKTIVGVSERELKELTVGKIAKAKAVGALLAKKAMEKKIKKVVFDKGSYAYHGRIIGIATGAREGGLEF
jgi:large subunit ribosomal protein L18